MTRGSDAWGIRRTALSKPKTVLLGPTRAESRLCGNCRDPQLVVRWSHGYREQVYAARTRWKSDIILLGDDWMPVNTLTPVEGYKGIVPRPIEHGFEHVMHVRCRKCAACRAEAASMWLARAKVEHARCLRTWFGTWTLSPQTLTEWQSEAVFEVGHMKTDREVVDELRRVCLVRAQRELTLMLKNMRNEGHSIRYLLVTEFHKSGVPHFHALLHCRSAVTYRQLAVYWKHGFTRFKLVDDERALGYVSKYVRKFNEGRVRSSLRYGAELRSKP